MKIALIVAGAAGMYCGSCLRDNALAAALLEMDEDVLLIPTYTPLLTDEPNVSIDRVFYGGINVYLQQKVPILSRLPWLSDKLDSPKVLRAVSGMAGATDASQLGDLTLSVLKGEDGRQRRELEKLRDWLADEVKPDIVNLPNLMFAGLARPFKERLGTPVVCTLSGEDIFFEAIPEPHYSQVMEVAREKVQDIDGFISPSQYFADFTAEYLDVPQDRFHVVHPGLNLKDFDFERTGTGGSPTIGYLARICPEKGLHLLIEAYCRLKKESDTQEYRLKVAGYLGKRDEPYLAEIKKKINDEGLDDEFESLGTVDREEKIEFLKSIDVLCVPTVYQEPKGIFVLEAMAAGLPVVLPEHGSFPELIEATGGGILFEPENVNAISDSLKRLLSDQEMRQRLATAGRGAIRERFTSARMAEQVLAVYESLIQQLFS